MHVIRGVYVGINDGLTWDSRVNGSEMDFLCGLQDFFNAQDSFDNISMANMHDDQRKSAQQDCVVFSIIVRYKKKEEN